MADRKCVAMILAGGRGQGLGSLTRDVSKPVVSFFGRYRMIDYTLNNCVDSGIETVAILSQYRASSLHAYIESLGLGGSLIPGGVHMLPPAKGRAYVGTADAVYQNVDFIEENSCEHVLILPGDHVYHMDYRAMLLRHIERNLDITIAATEVPQADTHRFDIIEADIDGAIRGVEEKSTHARSRLASMGVYIFKWSVLKKQLAADQIDAASQHGFEKDVIPSMARRGARMGVYRFEGYWRDVGTVYQLWRANMDMLISPHLLENPVFGGTRRLLPLGVETPRIRGSVIGDGCHNQGEISGSVLSDRVRIGRDARVVDCVVMEGATIGPRARLYRTIVGPGASVMDDAAVGNAQMHAYVDSALCEGGVSLIAPGSWVAGKLRLCGGSHVQDMRPSEGRIQVEAASAPT